MRRVITACLLALCLFAGCSDLVTLSTPEQAASPPPLLSPTEEVAVSAAPSTSPETEDKPSAEPVGSQPSDEAPPRQDALQKQLDGLFAALPGFHGSVLIEKAGQVILRKSYGMADIEKEIRNTPDTKYLVGSITKQFTAMAVMQLYEKGLLDIGDMLSAYLPEFNRGGEITLKNLLTHTSGIMDYMNDDIYLLPEIPPDELSARRIIDLVNERPLKFEPGLKYSYSNSNYLILGYIVEEISGLSYGEYLARNILEPLGMENTGVLDISNPPENMAAGHRNQDTPVRYFTDSGEIIAENANFVIGSYGTGCLYSTVGDLYLWDQALSTEKLVARKYINMMFNPSVPVPNDVIECAYGYGWVIDNDPDVGTIIRHTGVLSGFRAFNGLFADSGETVIILYNIKEFDGMDDMLPKLKQVLKAA